MQVEATAHKKENCRVQIDVKISPEEISKQYDSEFRYLGSNVSMPGFRKGHVPVDIVKKRFAEDIDQRVLQRMLPIACEEAMKTAEITPYAAPEIEKLPELKKDSPFSFTLFVETPPVVEFGKYEGLVVKPTDYKYGNELIDAEIDRIRENFAELNTKEGGTVETGNIAELSIRPVGGDEKDARTLPVEIGKGQLAPEMEQQIVGMKTGEEKEVTQPDKKISIYNVVSIKEKKLPPLDDEFAKTVGDYKSLDEFKDRVKQDVEKYFENRREQESAKLLLELVVNSSKFELPVSLVDKYTNEQVEGMRARMKMDQKAFENYLQTQGSDIEKMKEMSRKAAVNGIQENLAIINLSSKHELSVKDEDVDAEIAKMAEAYKQDPKSIIPRLKKSGQYDSLKYDLLHRKVVDFLRKTAEVKKGKSVKVKNLQELASGA